MYNLISRKNKQVPVGIWEVSQTPSQWCCVWLDDENMPQSLTFSQINETWIMNKIAESFPQYTTIQLKFITAILPHKIFLKTLILPHDISPKELKTQCIITLEENLPLPLNEIWFDFMDGELPEAHIHQHRRIDVFAVLKEVALQTVHTYLPINVHVLDCALNALVRGFQYFIPLSIEDRYDTVYVYRDLNFIVIFTYQPQRWLYQVKTTFDPLEFIDIFLQQHGLNPKRCIVYDSIQPHYSYPDKYTQITPGFSPFALGCALWAGGIEGK